MSDEYGRHGLHGPAHSGLSSVPNVMGRSTSVVYVTGTFPWPSSTGGHLRTASNLLALASLCPTHLAAFPKAPVELKRSTPLASILVNPLERPRIARRLSYRLAASAHFSHPYIERFERSGGLAALSGLLDDVQPAIVILEYPFYPTVARALAVSGRRFIADVADDRVSSARQIIMGGVAIGHRLRALIDLPLLINSERSIGKLDQVWFAGELDAIRAQRRFPALDVRLVPNVIEVAGTGHIEQPTPVPFSGVFLGSFDYPPNEEAALRFANSIAPRLRKHRPNASLGLIGRSPSDSIRVAARANEIDLHANVPNAAATLSQYAVLVVPLTMGSGTRLKILEALANGVPVVTTSIGMAGLELEPGRHLLVADDDESLADAVINLWESPDVAARLIREGRLAVRERYSAESLSYAISAALSGLTPQP